MPKKTKYGIKVLKGENWVWLSAKRWTSRRQCGIAARLYEHQQLQQGNSVQAIVTVDTTGEDYHA